MNAHHALSTPILFPIQGTLRTNYVLYKRRPNGLLSLNLITPQCNYCAFQHLFTKQTHMCAHTIDQSLTKMAKKTKNVEKVVAHS